MSSVLEKLFWISCLRMVAQKNAFMQKEKKKKQQSQTDQNETHHLKEGSL